VLVLNTDESYGPTLRGNLLAIAGVKIVAEIEEPAMLGTAVEQFPADVVLCHLDPTPESILHIAADVAVRFPALHVFALSEAIDGQLVLSAMRAGLREFLTKPIDPDQLYQALSKAAAARPDRGKSGKLISVVGSAGGVGATTLATNLAVELQDVSRGKVCIVDLDIRFGQVATFLDVQPSFTIADLCVSTESLDPQVVEKAVNHHASGIHVLARPNHFAQAETITGAHYAAVLGTLQEIYDFVVVDGPSRFDGSARAVLDMCDMTCLVVQLVVPSVRNAMRIVEAAQTSGYNLERFRVVCNRVSREYSQMSIDHVETTLNRTVFMSIPEDWKGVSSAINLGETLAASAPKSRARLAIREMAEKLAARPVAENGKKSGKKSGGLLSMFSE